MEAAAGFLAGQGKAFASKPEQSGLGSTRKMRSVIVHTGRFTCRLRMMSCCRRSAFSAMSSDLLLARSASAPTGKEEVSGLNQ
jgi:hypothetical protein